MGSSTSNSQGTVPNRSELFVAGTGRVPVKTDVELLDIARALNTQAGRPPTAPELISSAGGCQRQRALRAIQALRVELAEKLVRSTLVMPEAFRQEMQQLLARWMDCAATQLAERHLQHELQVENRLLAASETAAEQEQMLADLNARWKEVIKEKSAASTQASALQHELDVVRRERDRYEALSEERLRILNSRFNEVGDKQHGHEHLKN